MPSVTDQAPGTAAEHWGREASKLHRERSRGDIALFCHLLLRILSARLSKQSLCLRILVTLDADYCSEHQVISAQSKGPMIFQINTQALEEIEAAVHLFLNFHLQRASCCGAACTGPYSPASFPGYCDQVPQGPSSLSYRNLVFSLQILHWLTPDSGR